MNTMTRALTAFACTRAVGLAAAQGKTQLPETRKLNKTLKIELD
jgi:hypothetical protein